MNANPKATLMDHRSNVSLSPLHGLLAHLGQSSLGVAVGEVGDRSDSLIRILLGQDTGLFDTVGLENKFPSLIIIQC